MGFFKSGSGVDTGDTIRVPGAGNTGGLGSEPGCLYIKLKAWVYSLFFTCSLLDIILWVEGLFLCFSLYLVVVYLTNEGKEEKKKNGTKICQGLFFCLIIFFLLYFFPFSKPHPSPLSPEKKQADESVFQANKEINDGLDSDLLAFSTLGC